MTIVPALVSATLAIAFMAAASDPVRADVVRVEVTKLAYSPAEITVRAGDTIEWVNSDFVAHTATAKDKAWDVMLPPGKSGRVTISKAGTTGYFCRFHPNMTGRLSVTN